MSEQEQERYKVLTNQYQAFNNNVQKEKFIDFRAYYKSLFFEIIRDTRKIAEEEKIKEIDKNGNYKLSPDEINGKDIYLEKRRKILSIETNKKEVETAGKAKAIELSQIVYSLNLLDTSKTEEDYKNVLNKILDKREELLRKVDPYSKNKYFTPSREMNQVRTSNSVKVEVISAKIPLIDKNISKYLSPVDEVLEITTINSNDEWVVKLTNSSDNSLIKPINSSNWEWIWPEAIRKRRINWFLDFSKSCIDYINELSQENTLSPLELQEFRFLWTRLTDFFQEILKISAYNINFNKELIATYNRNFSLIKANWRLNKYREWSKNNEFRKNILSIFDFIDKETLYITSI